MKGQETRITQKYQTTIPKEVRKQLNVKPGQRVTWHVVKSLVVLDTHKEIRDPVKFLTTQIKLDVDAVKLVKEAREGFG